MALLEREVTQDAAAQDLPAQSEEARLLMHVAWHQGGEIYK